MAKPKDRKRAARSASPEVEAKKAQLMEERDVDDLVAEISAVSEARPKGVSKKDWQPYFDILVRIGQFLDRHKDFGFPPAQPAPAIAPSTVPPPTWSHVAARSSNRPSPRGVGPSSSGPAVSYEDHLRQRSIVIAGIAERDDTHTALEKVKADEEAVQEVLSALDVQVKPSSVFRMGKKSEDGKPRLFKVVLPARQFYYQALKNASKLRSINEFKGIYIRKSMTKEERAAFAGERKLMYQLRLLHGSDCAFVLYRDQVWLRSEIKAGKRVTIPQLPQPAENMHC